MAPGIRGIPGRSRVQEDLQARSQGRQASVQKGAGSDFHEWRKRVKYHVHHAKLLRPLWPKVNKAWRKEAKALSDILGNDHDLVLLDALLQTEYEELASDQIRKRLQKVIRKEQQHLREQAWEIGQRLYAEKPKALKKRWKRYWHVWQASAD